jgi:hypothetical protein
MADDPLNASSPVATPTTIHEADRATGPSGAVLRGVVIDFVAAVARRQAGLDIVVCGDDLKTNRTLAASIESAVGVYQRGVPHTRLAGPLALPHFQQAAPPPEGHTFYETEQRKAKRKP